MNRDKDKNSTQRGATNQSREDTDESHTEIMRLNLGNEAPEQAGTSRNVQSPQTRTINMDELKSRLEELEDTEKGDNGAQKRKQIEAKSSTAAKTILKVPSNTDKRIEPRQSTSSGKQVTFDEENLKRTYKPKERDYGLMKINEPGTPYASYDSISMMADQISDESMEDKRGVIATTKNDGGIVLTPVPKKRFEKKRNEHYRGEFPKHVAPPSPDDDVICPDDEYPDCLENKQEPKQPKRNENKSK